MTLIHLVRHAETLWHAENRFAGIADVALTPRGLEQAAVLAGWVERRVAEGERFDALVTSTLSRAILTARPSATVLGLEPRTDERLVEMAFGRAEGMNRAEMELEIPEALAAYTANPATVALVDGERGVDVIARGRAALEDIVREHPDGTVLVVAHSTLTRLLMASFLGMELDRYRATLPSVGNCHITTFELQTDGTFVLHAYNVPPSA